MPCRCDVCGKFRKESHCVEMEGDTSDGYSTGTWIECVHCMSEFDLAFYGYKPRTDNKRGMSLVWSNDEQTQ